MDGEILCVPLEYDTVWLECTSNTSEFGVLGPSTENRNALLLTEDGGKLVPTPGSKPENYRTNIVTTIKLVGVGGGITETIFRANGRQRDAFEHFLTETRDKQKEYFVQNLGFKQPDDFEFKKKEVSGIHTTELRMAIEKIPEFVAGSKMFLSPRIYKFYTARLPRSENRQLDYHFPNPFEKMDTTIFQLPEGFTIDALPEGKELKCAYAQYNTKYWFDEQKKAIYSTARLVLNQHRIPAAEYAEVKKFFDNILLDDGQRIVIRKL